MNKVKEDNKQSLKRKLMGVERKKIDVNRLITKMLVYSAIKIMAKVPLLYSVLNPETSSDSPSAKSKGVRLVSARVVVNQTKNSGSLIRIIGVLLSMYMLVILNEERIIRMANRVKDILTSYEIV